MPISLRLPTDIENQIAGFSARQGISKSAVIVRSIHEFLNRNAQPSSLQIYEEVMRDGANNSSDAASDAQREAAEQRPLKIRMREVIRQKHGERSASAAKSSKAK
jgi:gamma-glutamylcysteine synthetase